jgi:3-oxoacyl-[acyl-carrier-protein] synthase III
MPMGSSFVDGVRLAGIASAVPDQVVTAQDDAAAFGEKEMQRIARSTGIRERRVVPEGVCTSDLCLAATERLLAELGWARDTVDALLFVTQTPDYILPATSCSLHGRLRLSQQCAAFDVNLGCSGYTYGVWMGAHLVASGAARRLLLLVGETASRPVHPQDRSARPLFGDAGTASALTADPSAGRMHFRFGTDGAGQNHLIIPGGGFRLPHSPATAQAEEDEHGNTRSLAQVYMNGSEIFLFALAQVPPLIEGTLADAGWSADVVDAFVFHQANEFMLEHLRKSMGLAREKVPLALEEFGNTSSASIPLTITARLADRLRQAPARLVFAGFGVGFSWASVAVQTDGLVAPELVTVQTTEVLQRLAQEPQSHLPESIRRCLHATVG